MSGSEEEDISLLQIPVLMRLNKIQIKSKKRKYWVRKIFRKREENDAFNTLRQEMKLGILFQISLAYLLWILELPSVKMLTN